VSENPILDLQSVAVGYGRHAVLSDLTFSLRRGCFYGLLGANGSGKTTLLKTIAGILRPLHGAVILHPPTALGYVPQRDQLDPIFIFSAFEVAQMGVCGRVSAGLPIGSSERDRVHECLRRTGADGFSTQRFSELSGGQKQRVLIARALAAEADFLLLDEPTAGIDAAATRAIMELLCERNRERALTILMVNHDIGAMRRTVSEVLWAHQGKVLRGPADEMLRRERIEELLELQLT
jgi:ABC-type Mn2+/Zn2+ transport system ATPase subunit